MLSEIWKIFDGAWNMEIDELNKRIKRCKRCRLSETRMNAICGEGNLNVCLRSKLDASRWNLR